MGAAEGSSAGRLSANCAGAVLGRAAFLTTRMVGQAGHVRHLAWQALAGNNPEPDGGGEERLWS